MSKLIHKKKVVLPTMKYLTSIWSIGFGLMFASKNKIKKGVCLVMPIGKNSRFSCGVTMHFVFNPLEILFVNSEFVVVDKVILKPWKSVYIPKKPCKYVLESNVGSFKNIKIKDKVKIEI